MPNTRAKVAAAAMAVTSFSYRCFSSFYRSKQGAIVIVPARLNPLSNQALSSLPPEVIGCIADHFCAEEWARGPAQVCKALRAGRLQQLVIHPGEDANKGLQALAWAMANADQAVVISLKPLLKSKNPSFKRMLLKALQSSSGPMSRVTAFHFGVRGQGQGQFVGLVECQRRLLQRMPKLKGPQP